jgi:NAD(P)-dependent dehydrogenase (short-subunit alcohol dehydrogenase family)
MSLHVETMPVGHPSSLDLEGKVAVITGAARGIGRAIAEALAAQGVTVVVSDVTRDAAHATAAEIDGAHATACDISDESQVAELFAGTLSQHGSVDIAVANAGISGLGPITKLSFEDWRNMMSVNLDGAFLTVKHAARAMVGAGNGGSIITMASITGMAGTPPPRALRRGQSRCHQPDQDGGDRIAAGIRSRQRHLPGLRVHRVVDFAQGCLRTGNGPSQL